MNKLKPPLKLISVLLVVLGMLFSCTNKKEDMLKAHTKVALRDVGHQLLLANLDSTSLVLPVRDIAPSKYEVTFQNQLAIEPGNLVTLMQQSFKNATVSDTYSVEVKHCLSDEVAYSYEMSADKESTIIPCLGRFLPKQCYTIEVTFITVKAKSTNQQTIVFLLLFSVVLLVVFIKLKSKKASKALVAATHPYATLGSFHFYPEQNKLVKQAKEINLSKKECELLAIFVANPNEIIKRDELTKKVWEDHGVFVSRSLDTYISKLRKKLQDDDTIKLVNIHGVGYKLEVKI